MVGFLSLSALDRAGKAADDFLLEDREADQGGNHGKRRERQHLSSVHGMLRTEHLNAQRQRILARIIEQEQRQHIRIPTTDT